MDNDKPHWVEQLKTAPFTRGHFTPARREQVLHRTKRSHRNIRSPLAYVAMLAALAACGAFLVFAPDAWRLPKPNGTEVPGAEVSTVYNDAHGQRLLEVFPDPQLQAGQTSGYIYHFTAPFAQFQGRSLSIEATHLQSGYRFPAVLPSLITEPSSGYKSLERHTAAFAVPLGGTWRYDVLLDSTFYASVTVSVREPVWEVSGIFTSGSYAMRGKERSVGLIAQSFQAGFAQKYMWHLWSQNPELELAGPFEVKAVKYGEEQMIELFAAPELGGPLNGADRHIPSMMSLPEPGLWRLLPHIDGRLLDTIVVEVQ